jgi:hypothetical protein
MSLTLFQGPFPPTARGPEQMGPLASCMALQDKFHAKCARAVDQAVAALNEALQSLVKLAAPLAVAVVALTRLVHHSPSSEPVFKTALLPTVAQWGLSLLTMYVHEIVVKQAVVLAFGGRDALMGSELVEAVEELYAMTSRMVDSPLRQFAEHRQPWLPDSTVLRSGRLGLITQDTLTVYLSAWLQEPYLDSAELAILSELMACELS